MEKAIELVIAERKRQIEKEGWSIEHDDGHLNNELALAGAFYLIPRFTRYYTYIKNLWPFDHKLFKPTHDDRIRELTKGVALGVAEIERLIRLEERQKNEGKTFKVMVGDTFGGYTTIEKGLSFEEANKLKEKEQKEVDYFTIVKIEEECT